MSQDPLQLIELMQRDIKDVRKDLGKLEQTLESFKSQYTLDVTQNINTWNTSAANQAKVVWLVVSAVIVAVLAVVGLK